MNLTLRDRIKDMIEAMDVEQDIHLLGTPERVARAYEEFFLAGYRQDPAQILATQFAEERYDEVVLVNDIQFYSLCSHHLLPFFGKVAVAYVPRGSVVGLSKLPRLVECFARRLQIQERLTRDVADSLQAHLSPKGVAVVVKARHLCMEARGVEKQGCVTSTSCMLGVFRTEVSLRQEDHGPDRGDGDLTAMAKQPLTLIIGNVDVFIEGPYPKQLVKKKTSYKFNQYQPRIKRYQTRSVCLLKRNSFPSGLLPAVKSALKAGGHQFQITDRRQFPKTSRVPKLGEGWELRSYQADCLRRIISRRRGIVQIPTAGGKTLLSAAVIKTFNLPAVILVHTSALLDQTYNSFSEHFTRVGVVGGGKRDWQRATVCMIQTLHSLLKKGSPNFLRYKILIIDECHRVASRSPKATWVPSNQGI